MSCDPSNPLRGGACPIQNTGPPDVFLSLQDAIQNPEALGSSTKGDYNTIGKNLGALGYYAQTLGEGPQYNGYGLRQAYNTGIQCSNIEGKTAYRLADGTAVGVGGFGVVPRLIGSLAGLVPSDLVSSAVTGTQCQMMMVHENTPAEVQAIRSRGTAGVPGSNKVPVSDSKGVDYRKMDQLCRSGRLGPCKEYPIQSSDMAEPFSTKQETEGDTEEGFRRRGRRGGSGGARRYGGGGRRYRPGHWRYGSGGYGGGPYWWHRRWYNRPYYAPSVVYVEDPYPQVQTVVVTEPEVTPTPVNVNNSSGQMALLVLSGVVLLGTALALRK